MVIRARLLGLIGLSGSSRLILSRHCLSDVQLQVCYFYHVFGDGVYSPDALDRVASPVAFVSEDAAHFKQRVAARLAVVFEGRVGRRLHGERQRIRVPLCRVALRSYFDADTPR